MNAPSHDMHVLICTPCTGGMVTTHYALTILKIFGYKWPMDNVRFTIEFISIADIYKARNYFGALFVRDKNYTHLLFIDADIGFEPSLVEKMLDFDREFVAALCPERVRKADRFHTMARQFDDPAVAERLALDFVQAANIHNQSGDPSNPVVEVVKGFSRISQIGCGVMLLKRSVFEKIIDNFPDLFTPEKQTPYISYNVNERVHQCFSPYREKNGNFLSEDISFCRRWTDSGGEIWACVSEVITHVGTADFSAAYIERMRAGIMQAPYTGQSGGAGAA